MSRSKRRAVSVLHEHWASPMARSTRTKTRRSKRRRSDRWDRKAKHKGRGDDQ